MSAFLLSLSFHRYARALDAPNSPYRIHFSSSRLSLPLLLPLSPFLSFSTSVFPALYLPAERDVLFHFSPARCFISISGGSFRARARARVLRLCSFSIVCAYYVSLSEFLLLIARRRDHPKINLFLSCFLIPRAAFRRRPTVRAALRENAGARAPRWRYEKK